MRKVILILLLAIALGVALYWNNQKCLYEKKGSAVPLLPSQAFVPDATKMLQERQMGSFSRQEDPYLRATRLIGQKRYAEALQLIGENKHLVESDTEAGQKWADLLVETALLQKDSSQLRLLWKINPASIRRNQGASLLLAESFIDSLDYENYLSLRKTFIGKKDAAFQWVFFDLDKLLFEGKRQAATALLEGVVFEGDKEVERKLALAKLSIADKPQKAWDLLKEVEAEVPRNPEVAVLQANILEMAGKYSASERKYLDACCYSQGGVLERKQLASFYVRQGNFPLASEIFTDSLFTSDQEIVTQALFWSKMVQPLERVAAQNSLLQKESFSTYLAELKPWEFWNEERFSQLPSPFLPSEVQSAMWLKLFHYLQQGKEQEALAFLEKEAILEDSWDPGLLLALARTLSHRQNKEFSSLHLALHQSRLDRAAIERQQKGRVLISQLIYASSAESLDPKYAQWMENPHIWNYLLIDAGWNEAALSLKSLSDLSSEEIPKGIQNKLINAVKQNRGPKSALAFLQLLPESELVTLEKGLIYLSQKEYSKAEEELEKIAYRPDGIGEKASLALSQAYLDQKKYSKARAVLQLHETLAKSVQGKELYARIALKEGNLSFAQKIYAEIIEDSLEAKSYFAMDAYEKEDWQKAYQYTLDLLRHMPTSKFLQENLRKIESKLTNEEQYL